jgi:hypothetical protein
MTLDSAQRELIKGYIYEVLKQQHSNPIKHRIRDMHSRINFACPFCGDSTKDPKKKRGNLFWDSLYYHCYNDGCNKHISLAGLLKAHGFSFTKNPEGKFILDFIEEGEHTHSKVTSFDFDTFPELKERGITYDDFYATYYARPIEEGDEGFNYLKSRLLHKQPRDFAYNSYNKKLYILNTDNKREKIIGFQIRNLGNQNDKYLTFNLERINCDMGIDLKLTVESPDELSRLNKLSTIFNILRVDFEKTITIFEGPIDAKFMKNSIGLASVGRDKTAFLELPYKRFMLDNDKAGKKVSIELLREGHSVFMWKKFIKDFELDKYIKDENDKYKDLNDVIKLSYKYNLALYKNLDDYFTDSPYNIILI